ncbi:ATP-binding protein, partial [Schumannella luteola]
MGVGRAHAVALLGLDGAPVEIEADTASGLPAFVLVGLPDAALGEAKARVRSAI